MNRRTPLIMAVLAVVGLVVPCLILLSVFVGSLPLLKLVGAVSLVAPLCVAAATWVSRRRVAQPPSTPPMTAEQLAQVIKTTADLTSSTNQAELAIVDRLTHLYNYTYFQQRLQQEMDRCNRYKLSLSVLLIAIDDVQSLNDTHDHQQGDMALQVVARTLGKAIRVVDFCARYGGEEFVVVLPETGCGGAPETTGAVQVAERIGAMIAEESVRVTISIGVGVRRFPQDRDLAGAALIKQAEEQLSRARGEGNNRVCISPHLFPKPADMPMTS